MVQYAMMKEQLRRIFPQASDMQLEFGLDATGCKSVAAAEKVDCSLKRVKRGLAMRSGSGKGGKLKLQ